MTNINIFSQVNGCSVKLVSWNVKSLNHPVKRKKVFAHLKDLKTDIAFLQETHLRVPDHCRLKNKWVGQTFHSSFKSEARGVAIVLSKNIHFVATSVESDPDGRFLIVVGHLYGLPVILANIYAPNWDDHLFFSNFFSKLPNMVTHHLILGGDFNCVLSSTLDRSASRTISTIFN